MSSNSIMMHKLQSAINVKFNQKILCNRQQFYSVAQNRPVTTYILRRVLGDDSSGKNTSVELFRATSTIQIVLFLRDYWFYLNSWELPTDNETWNKIREEKHLEDVYRG